MDSFSSIVALLCLIILPNEKKNFGRVTLSSRSLIFQSRLLRSVNIPHKSILFFRMIKKNLKKIIKNNNNDKLNANVNDNDRDKDNDNEKDNDNGFFYYCNAHN